MATHFADIIVEIAKLRDYCLSETHLRGRHKARVFRTRLGLTSKDAELLRQVLLNAAQIVQPSCRRPVQMSLGSDTGWTSR